MSTLAQRFDVVLLGYKTVCRPLTASTKYRTHLCITYSIFKLPRDYIYRGSKDNMPTCINFTCVHAQCIRQHTSGYRFMVHRSCKHRITIAAIGVYSWMQLAAKPRWPDYNSQLGLRAIRYCLYAVCNKKK